MQHVPQIRIFLASPGDVNEERAVALQVFDMLEYDPLFRHGGFGGVSIHAVAWDAPPQRASKTPQTAIREGLSLPSQCDIVIALFWSRMGTPLPHPEYQKADGAPYLSGSEWEFWDAVNAERATGKPITLIYRRTEKPIIDPDDDAALTQYKKVREFFAQFRDPVSGALLAGVNEYTTPEDLRLKLLTHLRTVIDSILAQIAHQEQSAAASVKRVLVEAKPTWEGSPFPGLRAFTEKDKPIFFGRGHETSELVKRVESNRLVGVVAASGSGKSSLVAAGLIPRLRANAIVNSETGSQDWRFVILTPGDNPFEALFNALSVAFPEHAVSPFSLPRERNDFVESIKANPGALVDICHALLAEAKAPPWSEILFFVDQFEELFTMVKEVDRAAFVAILATIHGSRRLRSIATMRSDFYANCVALPALAALLKDATYPLTAPTEGALSEMINRPAERAGLQWDDGLAGKVLDDAKREPGGLALMAYTLDELYKSSQASGHRQLTNEAYAKIGGISGAIGKRAEALFEALKLAGKAQNFQRVFRELVVVDERGVATRQRAALSKFGADEITFIRAFTDARLLVTDENSVEVAHEAVFRSWDRLKNWIVEAQEDLILLRQVRTAADEWVRNDQPDYLRWPAERLKPVADMLERQQPTLTELERDFIEPEQARLLWELDQPETSHERRRDIGDRLAVIGDARPGVGVKDGIPDLIWLPVEVSSEPVRIKINGSEIGPITLTPFFIAKYHITYPQFQAFIDAKDGFKADRWWTDMPDGYKKQDLDNQRTKTANSPRDNVSWYQAVAFARWVQH